MDRLTCSAFACATWMLCSVLTGCSDAPRNDGVDGGADMTRPWDTGPAADSDTVDVALPGQTDAGRVVDMDAGRTDSAAAAGALFEPCAQGPTPCAPGFTCDRRFPQPFCGRSCSEQTCGPNGACVDGYCVPRCQSGARDCDAFGGMCLSSPEASYCLAACDHVGTSAFRCSGVSCDPYSGACGGTSTTGGEIGERCVAMADCRTGICLMEADETGPSGFVEGYCVGSARYPGFVGDGANAPRADARPVASCSRDPTSPPGTWRYVWPRAIARRIVAMGTSASPMRKASPKERVFLPTVRSTNRFAAPRVLPASRSRMGTLVFRVLPTAPVAAVVMMDAAAPAVRAVVLQPVAPTANASARLRAMRRCAARPAQSAAR